MINLHNLGIHVIQFPSGRYGFVGTLPGQLGTLEEPTTADIMGGRCVTDPNGTAWVVKFPSFETEDAARIHAALCGVELTRKR
jgi:hypothetical protein